MFKILAKSIKYLTKFFKQQMDFTKAKKNGNHCYYVTTRALLSNRRKSLIFLIFSSVEKEISIKKFN
jgi:hypothetical protein